MAGTVARRDERQLEISMLSLVVAATNWSMHYIGIGLNEADKREMEKEAALNVFVATRMYLE